VRSLAVRFVALNWCWPSGIGSPCSDFCWQFDVVWLRQLMIFAIKKACEQHSHWRIWRLCTTPRADHFIKHAF